MARSVSPDGHSSSGEEEVDSRPNVASKKSRKDDSSSNTISRKARKVHHHSNPVSKKSRKVHLLSNAVYKKPRNDDADEVYLKAGRASWKTSGLEDEMFELLAGWQALPKAADKAKYVQFTIEHILSLGPWRQPTPVLKASSL